MKGLDKFILGAVLILFCLVSLVPFFAMNHIKILVLPIHYLIVGGSIGILVVLKSGYQRAKLTSFDKWLFVLMLGFSLSLITSVDRLYTLQSLVSFFLRGVGVAFVVHKIVILEKRKNLLVLVLLFVVSIVCLIGLVEFFTGRIPFFHRLYIENVETYPTEIRGRSGMMSTIGHPLVLSAYLVLIIPVAILFFQTKKTIFSLLPLAVIFPTILLSFSRSSWISSILVLGMYFWNKENKMRILNFINKYIILLIVLSGVCILAFFITPRLKNTFLYRVNPQTLKSETLDSHRFNSYRTTWNIIRKYLLFGVGMGNYPKVHNVYRAEGTSEDVETPDNMYLRFLSETGLVGTLTFFCFIFYWLYQFWRNRSDSFIWTVFVGLTGFLINQMTGDFFYWLPTQFLFWFMLGIGVASLNEVKRNQE